MDVHSNPEATINVSNSDPVPLIAKPIGIWVLRYLYFVKGITKSLVISSVLLFYVPLVAVGFALQLSTGVTVFTRGISISLIWLAAAPLLIHKAYSTIEGFFTDHRDVFADTQEWRILFDSTMRDLQSAKYAVFGIPWSLLTSGVVTYFIFAESATVIRLWSFLTYCVFFYTSALGFYGIHILLGLMKRVCAAQIIFNPFHPDRFGGISDFGRFSAKIAVLFSSGALVFPLVFEITDKVGNSSYLSYFVTIALTLIFLATMTVGFVIPILEIKRLADRAKERIILAARKRLDEMVESFERRETSVLKGGLDVLFYYHFYYSELTKGLKSYPYDFKVIFEFAASSLLPIGMAASQLFLK